MSFNLSEKMIQTGGSDGFIAVDVKEFIRLLKELFVLEPFASSIHKDIDKLVGEKPQWK